MLVQPAATSPTTQDLWRIVLRAVTVIENGDSETVLAPSVIRRYRKWQNCRRGDAAHQAGFRIERCQDDVDDPASVPDKNLLARSQGTNTPCLRSPRPAASDIVGGEPGTTRRLNGSALS
jgi:hypothetical protein